MYFVLKGKAFAGSEQRVLFVTSYMRDMAYQWVEPHLTDHLDNAYENRKQYTKEIFGSWKRFKEEIKKVFGNVDEERTAERKLMDLRQNGSASEYASKFQQVASKTEWNDDALMAKFYHGLKDSVKDELTRTEKADDLAELIEKAIILDNRWYERNMERRNRGFMPIQKRNKNKTSPAWDPMDLDATHRPRKTGKKNLGKKKAFRPLSKEKKEQYEKKLCFRCGKPGHQARVCRGSQQISMTYGGDFESDDNWSAQEPPMAKNLDIDWSAQPKPNNEIPHGMLSWTGCYDDDCVTHKSDKEATGWYPKRPRKNLKQRTTQEINATCGSPEEPPSPDGYEGTYSGRMEWNEDHYSYKEDSTDNEPFADLADSWEDIAESEGELPDLENLESDWITLKTRHWRIISCDDYQCAQANQTHLHRIYEPEAPEQEAKEIRMKLCKEQECPNASEAHLHAHQGTTPGKDKEKIELCLPDLQQGKITVTKGQLPVAVVDHGFNGKKAYGHFPCDKGECKYQKWYTNHTHFRNYRPGETKNDLFSLDRGDGED